MHEIHDKALLQRYIQQHQIYSLFDSKELPFRLYEYAPGEIMNLLRPNDRYLKFVVEGVVDLYAILPSGEKHMIHRSVGFGMLGYMEFCGQHAPERCQEVVQTVRTLELDLTQVRDALDRDIPFLHYVMNCMAQLLTFSLPLHPEFDSLEDALLAYLHWHCPDGTIRNVEETAARLNHSRRQLQRVLKNLTEKGILKKEGRGCYRLINP